MHALLVQPWIVDFAAFDLWIRPLGLLYIAGRLRQAGFTIDLLDCLDRFHPETPMRGVKHYGTGQYHREPFPRPECLNGVERRYSRYGVPYAAVVRHLETLRRPDVILVGSGMTYWYPGVHDVIRLLRSRFGDTPVLLGGIYATLAEAHARAHSGADCVLPGEGEPGLLDAVADATGLPAGNAPDCTTLDTYPEPAVDLLRNHAAMPVLTTRGCPYRCTFCASVTMSGAFRMRNPDTVVDEVLRWHRTYGAVDFAFYDDALLIRAERHLAPILEGIIRSEARLRFHTPNGLFAARITPEIAQLMRRSGFTTLRLSLETTSPDRLDDISRKVTPDGFMKGLQALLDAGFQTTDVEVYLLMGLPGQSVEEVMDAIRFCARAGVNSKLSSFSPIPGTVDWDRAIAEGAWNPENDLLLTNNTLLPMRSGTFTWRVVESLKRWTTTLNHTAPECREPLLSMTTDQILNS